MMGDKFLYSLIKYVSPSSLSVKFVSLVLLLVWGLYSLVYYHYNPLTFECMNSEGYLWKLSNFYL